MDPLELINLGKPKFTSASTIKKNEVEYFNSPGKYQDYIEKNPDIEIINVISHKDYIVLTYKK